MKKVEPSCLKYMTELKTYKIAWNVLIEYTAPLCSTQSALGSDFFGGSKKYHIVDSRICDFRKREVKERARENDNLEFKQK